MPTICVFYGITIMMYLRDKEHNPPHVHAFYGNDVGVFAISNGELLNGYLPNKISKKVKEFVLKYQNELLEMWETEKYIKLKGID